jgi:hypothetical protein
VTGTAPTIGAFNPARFGAAVGEMAMFSQLGCLRMRPSAEREDSKKASQNLKHKKDEDTYIERSSRRAGRNHENIV